MIIGQLTEKIMFYSCRFNFFESAKLRIVVEFRGPFPKKSAHSRPQIKAFSACGIQNCDFVM
jgi:hypothetical protein